MTRAITFEQDYEAPTGVIDTVLTQDGRTVLRVQFNGKYTGASNMARAEQLCSRWLDLWYSLSMIKEIYNKAAGGMTVRRAPAIHKSSMPNLIWRLLASPDSKIDTPQAGVRVLVAYDDRLVHEGYYDGETWFFDGLHPITSDEVPITNPYAWMSMPAAPPRP